MLFSIICCTGTIWYISAESLCRVKNRSEFLRTYFNFATPFNEIQFSQRLEKEWKPDLHNLSGKSRKVKKKSDKTVAAFIYIHVAKFYLLISRKRERGKRKGRNIEISGNYLYTHFSTWISFTIV